MENLKNQIHANPIDSFQSVLLKDFLKDHGYEHSVVTPSKNLYHLISTSYIVPSAAHVHTKPLATKEAPVAIADILIRFISLNIASCRDYKRQNCLCLGYRLKSMYSKSTLTNMTNVECLHVNTLHSLVCTVAWQELADAVGELMIRHIFSRPVFMSCEKNNCYFQVCGTPAPELLMELRNERENKNIIAAANKKRCVAAVAGSTLLPRYKLFYNIRYQQKNGLPAKHLFNKSNIAADKLVNLCFPNFDQKFLSSLKFSSIKLICEEILLNYQALPLSILFEHYCGLPNLLNTATAATAATAATTADLVAFSTQPLTQEIILSGDNTLHPITISCASSKNKNSDLLDKDVLGDADAAAENELSNVINKKRKLFSDVTADMKNNGDSNRGGRDESILLRKKRSKRGCRAGKNRQMQKQHKIITVQDDSGNNGDCVELKFSQSGLSQQLLKHSAVNTVQRNNNKLNHNCDNKTKSNKDSKNNNVNYDGYNNNNNGKRTAVTVGEQLQRKRYQMVSTAILLSGQGYASQDDDDECDDVNTNINNDDDGDNNNNNKLSIKKIFIGKKRKSSSLQYSPSIFNNNNNNNNNNNSNKKQINGNSNSGSSDATASSSASVFPFSNNSLEENCGVYCHYHNREVEYVRMNCHNSNNSNNNRFNNNTNNDNNSNNVAGDLNNDNNSNSNNSSNSNSSSSDNNANDVNCNNCIARNRNKRRKSNYYNTICDVSGNGKGINIFELRTPTVSVADFLISICRKCFPVDSVWGSRHNQGAFLSSVHRYVSMSRHETMSLAMIANKLRITEMKWLTTYDSLNRNTADHSNHSAQCVLLAFLHWIFSDFITNLLNRCFYITEAEGRGQEVFYYRKLIWLKLIQRGKNQMNENFMEVSLDSLLAKKNINAMYGNHFTNEKNGTSNISAIQYKKNRLNALLQLPTVRFLPKKSSLRAITNMKTKKSNNNTNSNASNSSNIQHSNNGSGKKGVITNAMLFNCLHVIKHYYLANTAVHGFGVFGFNEVVQRFQYYKQQLQLQRETHTDPQIDDKTSAHNISADCDRYYVAVLDIEKCFDNIDTVQLYDIVQDLVMGKLVSEPSDRQSVGNKQRKQRKHEELHDDGLLLQRYSLIKYLTTTEKLVSKSIRKVIKSGEILSFEGDDCTLAVAEINAVKEMSSTVKNGVFSDGVVCSTITINDILQLLKQHLFSHLVRVPCRRQQHNYNNNSSNINNNINMDPNNGANNVLLDSVPMAQVKGIPQGSILSSLLCNLYYGYAEHIIFNLHNGAASNKNGTTDCRDISKNSLVLRFIDDYLIISNNKEEICNFLQVIHTALVPYGGTINPAKTRVNFDVWIEYGGNRMKLNRTEDCTNIPWCGFTLNAANLTFSPNYSRLLAIPLLHSFAVDCRHVGESLRKLMKSFVKLKVHSLALHSEITSTENTIKVICCNFLVAAKRSVACERYIRRFHQSNCNHRCSSSIRSNLSYFGYCITEAVKFASALIINRIHHLPNNNNMSKQAAKMKTFDNNCNDDSALLTLSFQKVSWIGLSAFQMVLLPYKALYHQEVQLLQHQLKQLQLKMSAVEVSNLSVSLVDCQQQLLHCPEL